MLEFGRNNYSNIVYCNFENNSSLAKAFENSLNTETIINALKALLGVSIEKGTSLIFFDEIQHCEKALINKERSLLSSISRR